MAIPGFTADAALYPTTNLYSMVGPGGADAAHGVTANAHQSPLRRRQLGSTEIYRGYTDFRCRYNCQEQKYHCDWFCGLHSDAGYMTVCQADCSNKYDFCYQLCEWMYGPTPW
jgi:hypothetical protein